MPAHRLAPTARERWQRLIPFGLGQTKPKHFRDMLKVAWGNRDNLPYAWKVLSRGVCDGCALGVAGFHDWTMDGVHLCMTRLNLLRLNTMPAMPADTLADVSTLRGRDNRELRALGRLAHPLRRRRGEPGFTRISWDDALRAIGSRIRSSDPRRVAFFVTSRGVTNEVYYVAQKAARFLGTNHVDNAARLCHSPSTAAMKQTLGVTASTCSYRDWLGTDVIVFFGSNPANDQPVSTKYLHMAKAAGTKVILVNPYLEPGMKRYWVPSTAKSALFGTDLADYWFPVAQGGDIAFLYGTLKHLEATGQIDRAFLDAHTDGWEALAARARALDWPALETAAGLPRPSMEEFANLIGRSRNGVVVWSMGITQHAFGADGVRMILNTALARGWLGRDRCGVMPIRGHSSVQGGAEMGAYATAFPGGKAITPANAAALAHQYGFDVPDWPGLSATEMVEASHRGELDVFHLVGGNFLRTLPDPDYVAAALQRVPLRVHQDIIVTDQMLLDPADEVILLPAKTRYEQDDGGTETSTERRVMFSPEIARAVGEARAEWKILRDVALAAYPERGDAFGCVTGQELREEIARVVPFYDGVQRLKRTGDAFQYGGPHLCADGICPTEDGRAHLTTVELPSTHARPPGVFHVSTRRGKQFNTLIYADVDPLNGAPRDAVLMNSDDAATLHLKQGDRVALVNDLGRYEARVWIAPLAPGNLQIHWPEGNHLIRRGVTDAGGGVPDYNALVRLVQVTAQA
jgi:molybdopterin-dependent oxidoreductase alpha subunit